jgi:MinD superfamily P-loop ATPase
VGCGICTTKCKFDAIKLEKTIDNVGKTYYRTLMQAATNTPLAVGRLAKKKLGAVKK